jgi:integrase
MERNRGEHGWFAPGEHSYAFLLKSEAVSRWAATLKEGDAKVNALRDLNYLLAMNQLGPEEFLSLPPDEIKQAIEAACLKLRHENKAARAKRLFYSVMRFLNFNHVKIEWWRDEKRRLLAPAPPKRIIEQYVPTKEDVYRMADAAPSLRDKAIILCLWQSGVRAGCLTRWKWHMFKDTLFPKDSSGKGTPRYPVPVLITTSEDRKLSSYGLGYYYTFLNVEAGEVLRDYLKWRMRNGWEPRDDDSIFVTEGTVSRGRSLTEKHIAALLKLVADRAGIDPRKVWPHTLRKAFRKTLYAAAVPDDVAEALMGHKLAGSRGNYFDYHDTEFVAEEYLKGDWGRTTSSRIENLERRLEELEEILQRFPELAYAREFQEWMKRRARGDQERDLQEAEGEGQGEPGPCR